MQTENVTPEAPQAPDTTASSTPDAGTPAPQATAQSVFSQEEAESIKRFLDANGGFDKVKQFVSQPRQPEPQPAQPQQPQQPQQPAPQPEPFQMGSGYASQHELFVQDYFEKLSQRPEYANISGEIHTGEVLRGISSFGIPIEDQQGNINIQGITQYLDLYSKSKPAPITTTVTEGSAPTVDYYQVEGDIQNQDQALQILQDSLSHRVKGEADNPQLEAARKYLQEQLYPGSTQTGKKN